MDNQWVLNELEEWLDRVIDATKTLAHNAHRDSEKLRLEQKNATLRMVKQKLDELKAAQS